MTAGNNSVRLSKPILDIVLPAKAPEARVPRSRRRLRVPHPAKRWLPAFALLLAIVALTIVLTLAIAKRSDSVTGKTAAQQVEQAVSRHYLLPITEEPALATVTDETQLRTPFLKQAKDGDKLLIYAQAKIVIIYRPGIDRIVAVGPVELDTSGQSDTK